MKVVAMEFACKMQLLQGSSLSPLPQKKNQCFGAVQSRGMRRSSRSADTAASESCRLRVQLGILRSADATAFKSSLLRVQLGSLKSSNATSESSTPLRVQLGSLSSADSTDSESFQVRAQLGIRAEVAQSAQKRSSSASLLLSSDQDGPALSGAFPGSPVKRNRSSSASHLCQVLSSALEAHALTQIQADEFSRAYQDPGSELEPPGNEEAEGVFQVPIGKLRALLSLWDIDSDKTNNYYELLIVADFLERLGLDVYFRQEVREILDHIFRVWTENSLSETAAILGDLQVVGLAFYLLRSHQYVDVEPSIFHLYKREDGSFCKTPQLGSGDIAARADLTDLVNLLRASDLKFRRDAILHDASKFASTALSSVLDGAEPLSEKASAELKYRLSFPWAVNFRMLETRHTVLNFELESVTARCSRLSSEVISLMLSTATQLFNHYHSAFQLELEDCKRWSVETGGAEVNVRPPMVLRPFHLGWGYDMPQARYSYSRAVWAKVWYLMILQDDLYEGAHSYSMDEILIFMDAFRQFDPSILEKIPNFQGERYKSMRVVYRSMYDITKSWAEESSKWYNGRDLLRTFIDIWMVRLEVYLNEKRWMEENYKFTIEEYVEEYGKWSFAVETGCPVLYYSIPGYTFSPSFFETRPDMDALFGMSKAARFLNDTKSYQHEMAAEGKTEFVHLLMEENPGFTEEDAIIKSKEWAQSAVEETTEAILQGRIPYQAKQILLTCSRTIILMYYYVDGLRDVNWPLAELCEPLPTHTTVD